MTNADSSLPNILVAGVGPVPPEAPDRLFAPGIRVWGMARELARAGHAVRLVTAHFSGDPIRSLSVHDLSPNASDEIELGERREIEVDPDHIAAGIAREADDFAAAALVGTTDLINRELARIKTDRTIWCDFFGDPMAERQMLARTFESDATLADQWKTLAEALSRADRVSGCSRYQVGALMGEMAAVGRMNRFTAEETLAHLIRPWVEPIAPTTEPGPFLRGPVAPQDAFIAIQTGGFNTWMDIETLFAGLEQAMRAHPKLRFATTGGAIKGHNERSFGRFKELVQRSAMADRFHFLGWLPLGHVPRVIAEADLGLNVDLPCAEGWLGTRNRIMDWLAAPIPVVSTLGSELAEDLAERDYIVGVEQAQPEILASAIGRAIADPHGHKSRAAEGAEYLAEAYSARRSLAPLLAWAREPRPAPDLQLWRGGEARPPELWAEARSAAERLAEAEELRRKLVSLEARADELAGSRLIRAAVRLRKLIRGR